MHNFLVVLCIVSSLAGCVRSDEVVANPDEEPETDAVDHTERRQPAPVAEEDARGLGRADPAAYFSMAVEATPAGSVTAYRWTIPEGSYIPAWFDEDEDELALEIAPRMLDDSAEPVTEWFLLLFHLGDEGPKLGSVVGETTYTVTVRDPLGSAEEEVAPRLGPTWTAFYPTDTDEGDEIGVVVLARAPTATPFEVGLRVLPDDPIRGDLDRPDDFDEFVEEAGEGPVAELPATRLTSGFQLAAYADVNAVLRGFELSTPAVKVTHAATLDLRPVSAVREVTVETGYETSEGWTYGTGFYWAHTSVGTWSVDAEAHGTAVAGHSVITDNPATSANWIVLGFPYFALVSEGAGGSHASLHLDVAQTGTFEFVIFEQLDLSTTMEALFGEAGPSDGFAYTGLAGDVPPAVRRSSGDSWTIDVPGQRSLTIANFPPLPV